MLVKLNSSIISSTQAALAETDRCVKCGLCLPHCPTYRLYADENESPRGRIALAEALLQGVIEADESAKQHIDRCLLCQRCEKVCPSQVNYSRIIDEVRQQWASPHWIGRLAKHPRLFSSLYQFAQFVPDWSVLPANMRLAKAMKSQHVVPKPGVYPASGKENGRIGLLLGCVARTVQADALQAGIRVLNALGYTAVVAEAQGCCGALDAHQGNQAEAQNMALANQQAFANVGELTVILTIASGCAAYLQQHPFSDVATNDIVPFLAQQKGWSQLEFKPLNKTVAIYQPCSLVNGLSQANVQTQLLQQIPEIALIELGVAGECCGAAGNHVLSQREQAVALRQPLLDILKEQEPDYLVTNNIGCALHLAEGIKRLGLAIVVMHPVQLLEQQL